MNIKALLPALPGISISRLRCLVILAAACVLLIYGHGFCELATRAEMDRVAQNWLTQTVFDEGKWAGSSNPYITTHNELWAGDTVLAMAYNINPRGFIIVPVLKEMVPIKAYSDQSNIDVNQEGGFVQLLRDVLSYRLNFYARVYGSLDFSQPASGVAVFGHAQKSFWERLTLPNDKFISELRKSGRSARAEAGPLLTSMWHQFAPYNNLCPMGDGDRCVVGCTNTGVTQIMKYWEWPVQGLGNNSYLWYGDGSCGGWVPGGWLFADFSDSYDWENMPDSCDDCPPEDSAALAELNYEIGVAFESLYGACGTGAMPNLAIKNLPMHFKYSPELEEVYRVDYDLPGWFNLIKEEIDNNRPILYTIHSHVIVCDGWREQVPGQYEYHMNYGWRNEWAQYTTWYVFDSLFCFWIEPDSLCPTEYDRMVINIYPQQEPILRYYGMILDDSPGDGDGHAEAGESVNLDIKIINHGSEAVNISGLLTTDDPYVTVISFGSLYDDNTGWREVSTSLDQYALAVDPACPSPHIALFQLQLSANDSYVNIDTLMLYIGNARGFVDDVESGEGLWSYEPVTISYVDEWHIDDFRHYEGTSSWKVGDYGEELYCNMLDGGLVTPPVLLPHNAVLSFWHWIDMEKYETGAYDGGIVMISSGDGEWEQITPDGGYTDSLLSSCHSAALPEGTYCFSGTHDWSQVEFDLSEYSGVVQIMFRAVSDASAAGEGWYIDNVEITGEICGDADNNGTVNILDITFLISFLYKDGPAPQSTWAADPNGTGTINILDITYLINYLYKDGPEPACL